MVMQLARRKSNFEFPGQKVSSAHELFLFDAVFFSREEEDINFSYAVFDFRYHQNYRADLISLMIRQRANIFNESSSLRGENRSNPAAARAPTTVLS